jgi:hypothetical protein
MSTVAQIESMLRDRAQVYPGHPAVPFLRAVAEAFVEYAQEQVAAEREACAKLAEGEINGDFRSWPHQPGDYDNVCMQSKLADAIAASIRNR